MVITHGADNNSFKGVERGKELQLAGAVTHALTRIMGVKTSELSEPLASKPILAANIPQTNKIEDKPIAANEPKAEPVNKEKEKQDEMDKIIKKMAEQMEKIEKDIEPFRNIVNYMFYNEIMQSKIQSRNPTKNHDDENKGGKK